MVSGLHMIFTAFPASPQQQGNAQNGTAAVLESKVQKAWEDYKTKNKADLASLLADDFRIIQDGDAAFGDKKVDVEEVDTLNVSDYSLIEFHHRTHRQGRRVGDLLC
jgi:hypothetical protein